MKRGYSTKSLTGIEWQKIQFKIKLENSANNLQLNDSEVRFGLGNRKTTKSENQIIFQFLRDHPFETSISAVELSNFPASSKIVHTNKTKLTVKNISAVRKSFFIESDKIPKMGYYRSNLRISKF